MPEPMSLPGLGLACLSYDAQVAARGQVGEVPYADSAAACDARELRVLRVGIGGNGPVAAFRWRGVPGEEAVPVRLRGVAEAAGPARRDGSMREIGRAHV